MLAGIARGIPLNLQRMDSPPTGQPEWQKFLTIKLEKGKVKTGELPRNFWGNMKEQYEAHNKDYTGVYKVK